MKTKIEKLSLGEILRVSMNKGEEIFAQPGALISAKGEIEVESKVGNLASSFMRAFAGGESLFQTRIKAVDDNVEVEIGTAVPSELIKIELDGAMLLGDGAYLAHTGDIDVSAKWGGLNSLVAGSGLLFLYAKGKGDLYLAGGEAILSKELKEGEFMYLDNTSFLAVPEGTKMEKKWIGKGLMSKVFSGEGFMFKIYGPTTVIYQTEAPSALARAIARYLRLR